MRKTYHYCLSSHDEVLFRDQEDFNYAFNCLSLAGFEIESRQLAEAFMSTHLHSCNQTDDPNYLYYLARNMYSRYFNHKYHRKGRLGEKIPFVSEVIGNKRLIACNSYILRQGLHHGICASPFEYKNCSVGVVFQEELGHRFDKELLPDHKRHLYLPEGRKLKKGIRMDKDGLLFREDVVDVNYLEEMYISVRGFVYKMNLKDSREWEKEQLIENGQSPVISLDTMEPWASPGQISKMKRNECAPVDNNRMTDLELCELIDCIYVPRLSKRSTDNRLYDLSESARAQIGNTLYSLNSENKLFCLDGTLPKKVSTSQISRCLKILPH